MNITSQTVYNRLEKIRKKMHNGKNAYDDVNKLMIDISDNGINASYIAAHCQFVADIMDGVDQDEAYKKLCKKTDK